jgi:hypothetical protein
MMGTYKVRNEIETKRNETKRNEINENETKGNETKRANPTWIELQVMYVRSTVTDRHARWVIINQNYCI